MGCGNFNYEREQDFVFLNSRDVGIAREKVQDTVFEFYETV